MNVNSFPGKYDALKTIIPGNVDVMVLVESKIDHTYPLSQFLIDGFASPFRRDRDANGGGILIYVREDIPCKLLSKHDFPEDIEGIFIELNLRKMKWLLFGTYHPPSQNDKYYFECVGKALDVYSGTYDRLLLCGDFNAEEKENVLSDFLDLYDLKSLNQEKTCFKSIQNPSCVDLFLTNCNRSFQHTKVISSGMSDFHKMVVTVMKATFPKSKPKEIYYRSYKQFDKEKFREDLKNKLNLETENGTKYQLFEKTFLEVLERHAPLKRKLLRANEVPYMTKALRKAIATRSRLENRFHRLKTSDSKKAFRKQRNYCSRLYKKERKRFYVKLDSKCITDNKKFWQTMKPFFTDKGLSKRTITLIKGNKIISDDVDVANALNTFFESAVKNLEITDPTDYLEDVKNTSDPIDAAILKFRNHPSIKRINENVKESLFSFCEVKKDDIEDELKKLNIKKANTFKNIPAKQLKENRDICAEPILGIINEGIRECIFDDKLKLADVTPIHKRGETTEESNYRNISVLPVVSKVYEKVLQKQMGGYMEDVLSPYLCGYRKGYNAQHALLSLLEKWRISLDKGGYGGAILMDLSKAFDTINYDLLLAKLDAYGFDRNSLKLINSYLTNRWQRTKINTSFSTWSELMSGVPQGSVLGPLLFNIYLNDLFYIILETDVCNFADDTTPYTCDMSLEVVMDRLESVAEKAVEWFKYNYMKLNADKCHLLVCGHKFEQMIATINDTKIIETYKEKLLGVVIDSSLSFEEHIKLICKKASAKLNALSRQCKVLPFYKRRTLMKAFFDSQFAYAPLVWMCHSRELNNKINSLHYRALRMVYKDDESSFEELLKKDESVSIHHRNIHCLAIEMFKVKNGLAPTFMSDVFPDRNLTNDVAGGLRSQTDFYNSSNPKSIFNGVDSLRHLGPRIWNILPESIKKCTSLEKFKCEIKRWIPKNCPCRLCKTYVQNLGFCTITN